jgi:hypothetical protein
MITAPAAFSRDTASASSVGSKFLNCGKPQVVGSPATLNGSFSVTGMPSSGRSSPRASRASAAFAASLARSKSRTMMALNRRSSDSIRAITCARSSDADIVRDRNARVSSAIDEKSQSEAATI